MMDVVPARILLPACLAMGCCACSTVQDTFSDKRVEYEKATSLPSLEIPPDLVTPAVDEEMALPSTHPKGPTRYSEYSTGKTTEQRAAVAATVLPPQDGIEVMREGNQRWLRVRGTPDQLWTKVHDFWLDQGFVIKVEQPRTGILETDWLENRANIPQSGVRALFGKVLNGLYDSSTRDRFRIRLERSETPDTTEVYVAHQGAEEVTQGEGTVWQMRPNDLQLEAVMLQRMMMFLGVPEQKTKTLLAAQEPTKEGAHLNAGNDSKTLLVEEDFPRAWRHVGLALDRTGFTVEDRDRSRGIYFVRYKDPLKDDGKKKGFFSKLAFWRSDTPMSAEQFQIHLEDRGARTEVTVLNKDGAQDTSPTGQRILTLLQEQLR